MNLSEISSLTESQAREYLERLRWPNGVQCPHCESIEVTKLLGKAHREGTYQCKTCREQFTVTVGTVLEDSHIPLKKWLMAFHFMCSSKKGISANQLKRDLGLGSYKTAWFMAHRVRYAMSQGLLKEKPQGRVEVDETYIGGKRRKGNPKSKRGRGTKKAPAIVLVEKDGNAVSKPLERVSSKALKSTICDNVDIESKMEMSLK